MPLIAYNLPRSETLIQTVAMASQSYLRATKSETRDLADYAYRKRMIQGNEDVQISNRSFFVAFVVIAALVTLLALVLR